LKKNIEKEWIQPKINIVLNVFFNFVNTQTKHPDTDTGVASTARIETFRTRGSAQFVTTALS